MKESSVTCRHEQDGIFVKQNDYFLKVLCCDILYVEADGSYTSFYLHNGRKLVTAYNLAFVTRHLPATHFIRVHQKYVWSLFDVNTWVGNILRIGDKTFPLGRTYCSEVLAAFNNLTLNPKIVNR